MSKLSRFLRLERARPADAGEPAMPEAPAPQRFAAIEPLQRPPSVATADPFAPPPEATPELRLDLDSSADVVRGKQDRRARAEAVLAEARDERLEQEAAREGQPAPLADRTLAAVVRLGVAGRLLVIGAIVSASFILADVISPLVWIIALVAVGGIAASFLATEHRT